MLNTLNENLKNNSDVASNINFECIDLKPSFFAHLQKPKSDINVQLNCCPMNVILAHEMD